MRLNLVGSFSAVAGDQLQLVKADGGVATQRIISVEANDAGSILRLERDPGEKFHGDVFGVVLKRSQRCSIPIAIGLVLLTGAALGLIHGLLITRAKLQPFVDRFFRDVLVMADDANLRRARLTLLARLHRLVRQNIGDISEMAPDDAKQA